MPLVFVAYLTFAAGLLSGFGGAVFPVTAVGVAVLAVSALQRHGRGAVLGAVLAAGAVAAETARAHDARCQSAAIVAGLVSGELGGAAAPGRRSRLEVRGRACRLRALLMLASGRAAEGDRVRVLGRVAPTDGGVLVQEGVLERLAGPTPLTRLRLRAGTAIDRLFGADAPLARALLIADQRGVDATVRARFADAGMIHLLSVSGLHVAIVAAAVELLLVAARCERATAAWGSLAMTALYVLVIGAPAPAVRSAVMLGAGAVTRLLQRPTSPWAPLALGAALPLVDPRTVLDLGYQLSVIGIAALIASGALSRRLLTGRVAGWRLAVARDLLTSVVASVVTLPLVAWTFGRASLIAPITNMLAGPLFGLLQPALFFTLLVAPIPPLAGAGAAVSRALLALVDLLARVAAAVPFAAVPVAPTLLAAVALAMASGALILACVSRFPARAVLAGATALVVALASPLVAAGTGQLELHLLDVGQGDAVAIRTPRGRWVLVDAGRSWPGGDAGQTTVVPYVRRLGGEVAAFILTHPHTDHVGGAATVMRLLRPHAYWDAAYVAGAEPYRASLHEAAARDIPWHRVHPGDSLAIDGVSITFLAPDSAWTAALADPNEASTVALVRYRSIRFLLVGDAERGEERWLLDREAAGLHADVLKVGHHGSSTSSTAPFLDAVRPRLALVSVGAGNTYGHPSPDVMRSLTARGAQVLRTDLLGTIVVATDGERLRVTADGTSWVP